MLSFYNNISLYLREGVFQNKNATYNEIVEESEKKTRISFFERFFGRTNKPPPPPPTKPLTPLEKFWKALRWEGFTLTREVASSSVASVASVLVTHPLEIMKAHYLTIPQGRQKGKTLLDGLKFINEMRRLYRDGGIARFYEGHMGAQRESLFQTVSMFYSQQRIFHQLAEQGLYTYPNACSFVSGFLSATIAVVALKPIAAYRERQVRKEYLLKRYGPIEAAYVLRRREKFSGLFKGCFHEFMYLGTQYGLRFFLYNLIRDYVLFHKNRAREAAMAQLDPTADLDHYRVPPIKYLNTHESMFAGAASGIISDVIAHPLEVVGAYLQMGSLQRQQYCFKDTCRRYHQCIWLLLRKYKLKGLYTGFTPTILKSTICVALQFTVYDRVIEWIEAKFGEISADKVDRREI